MDKKKSGKIIKDARIQKNYTQSELGDLVGVSNKAVSRWENGESFPDVGVLENLASILDISIQDIITGEKKEKDEKDDSVITEIVRVASLQQREKKRFIISSILLVSNLILGIIAGYSAMGNKGYILVNDSIISYIVLMIISYAFVLHIIISEDIVTNTNNGKIENSMKIFAFVLLVLALLIGFGEIFFISKDFFVFGIEKAKLGPFINGQIICLFIVNIVWSILAIYMYEKKNLSINSGWLLSVGSMYLLVLYGDLLHRMNSVQGLINSLIQRSIVVIVILGVMLLLVRVKNKKKVNLISKQGD